LKRAFDKAERFNNKIFVTKIGPLFASKENYTHKSKDNNKKTQFHTEATQHALKPEQLAQDDSKKKKFKETYLNANQGYSLGLAPSKLNLRKKRKENHRNMMKSFEEIFGIANITKEVPSKSSDHSSERSQSSESYRHKDTTRPKLGVKTIKSTTDEFYKQRSKKFEMVKQLKKQNEMDVKQKHRELQEREERIANNPKLPMYRTRSYNPKERKREVSPGPATYDVRGNLDINKGFTFGSKNYKQMAVEKHTPDFVLPRTDIEMILDRPKFAESRSERFKEKPVYIPPSAEHICI
jgi:hypothetical protein